MKTATAHMYALSLHDALPIFSERIVDRGDVLPVRGRNQALGALDCRGGDSASSSPLRNAWTKAIAMLPSPTAAATRFTGPQRTSPHAKIPGTLVSSR